MPKTGSILLTLLLGGLRSAHAQAIQWSPAEAGGTLPDHAVRSGGADKAVICRVFRERKYLPGEVTAADRSCVTTLGGREVRAERFEVLVGPRSLEWAPGTGAVPVRGAVAAGRYDGQRLYICRAGGRVGRLVAGVCTVNRDGRAVETGEFEVLALGKPPRAPKGPRSRPLPKPSSTN